MLSKVFTPEELYEINDAIAQTLNRMMAQGISTEEQKMNSAAHLMSAWKKLIPAALGSDTDPEKLDWYVEYKSKIKSLKMKP